MVLKLFLLFPPYTYQSATVSLGGGLTEDDARGFLTADTYHKKIDIAEITEYVEFNCLNAAICNNNIIDEPRKCH